MAIRNSMLWIGAALTAGLILSISPSVPTLAMQPQGSAKKDPADNGVPIADAARLEKEVHSLRGRVVVVNFWTTLDGPSGSDMSLIVTAFNRHKGDGLAVLSVCVDRPETRDSRIIPFLEQYGASFAAFIKADGDNQAFLKAVDSSWNGSIPRTYVVGRDGTVRKAWPAMKSTQLEPVVARLLKEPALDDKAKSKQGARKTTSGVGKSKPPGQASGFLAM